MQERELDRWRLEDIRQAIGRAEEYAAAQGVPLTVERLAAELDMELGLLQRIARGEYPVGGRQVTGKVALLRRACGQATASVMEHAMQRGSSPNMHLAYLKNNAGYDVEKAGKAVKDEGRPLPPVIFVGEEAIPN